MDRVSWTTPKADDETDQRVVINPGQGVGLLKAVEDSVLPETGCDKLLLSSSTQYIGAWGANGQGREDRALKPHLAPFSPPLRHRRRRLPGQR